MKPNNEIEMIDEDEETDYVDQHLLEYCIEMCYHEFLVAEKNFKSRLRHPSDLED